MGFRLWWCFQLNCILALRRFSDWLTSSESYVFNRLRPFRWEPIINCAGRWALHLPAVMPVGLAHCGSPSMCNGYEAQMAVLHSNCPCFNYTEYICNCFGDDLHNIWLLSPFPPFHYFPSFSFFMNATLLWYLASLTHLPLVPHICASE